MNRADYIHSRGISFILMIFLCTVVCYAQEEFRNPSVDVMQACGLPVVIIETQNSEEPYSELIEAPQGEWGVTITNVTKVPGRLMIIQHGDTLYDSGEYAEGESGMTIRHRGNTSARFAKKPFKINLQKKADLLSRGEARYKDKDWILLTDYGMSSSFGLMVNELLKMLWTPQYKRVNVFVNGDYRGLYTLIESVKRNADCRLDVDKSDGFIFECDPYWWNENVSFQSNSGRHFTFKYPQSDDITNEQIAYIQNEVNVMEDSFQNGNYEDVIDTESFARWMLAHDILGSSDAGGANMFMMKYNRDSKIQMGNLWDFGSNAGVSENSWANVHNSYFYYSYLFNNSSRAFVHTYKGIWNAIKDSLYESLKDSMESLASSIEANSVKLSLKYEQERWQYFDADTLSVECNNLMNYYTPRFKWLDIAINDLPETDAINDIEDSDSKRDNCIYSVTGQRVISLHPGIYISKGRKFLISRNIKK